MTDEKKKPEEDEVSDEQLDDVAGGVDAIQNVSQLSGPRTVEAQGPTQPGELQIYDDQIVFKGNGVNSAAEVLRRGSTKSGDG